MPFPIAELEHVAYIPGKWYPSTLYTGEITQVTPGSGVLDSWPIRCEKPVLIDAIAARVFTAFAGSNIRLGVWQGNGTYRRPRTLLREIGSVSAASVGVKELAIDPPLLLPYGYNWPGCATQNGTPAMSATRLSSPLVGGDNYNWLIGGTSFPGSITRTGIQDALPDPFVTDDNDYQGLGLPIIVVVRIAS